MHYDDLLTGILTFLALLIAFFAIYVRPSLPRLLWHSGARDNETQYSVADLADYINTQVYSTVDVKTTTPDFMDSYSQVSYPAVHDEGIQTEYDDSDLSEPSDGPHDLSYC